MRLALAPRHGTIRRRRIWILPLLLVFAGLSSRQAVAALEREAAATGKIVHVVVALCDNKYQGIVPVPQKIGNGDDPANNLYWGAAYGVKTFFSRAKDWTVMAKALNPKPAVLERYVFKHASRPVYLIADAYRGREIRKATSDFFQFAAGRNVEVIALDSALRQVKLRAGGGAGLVAYVGHNGLMDFSLPEYPSGAQGQGRSTIILACASKPYFAAPLRRSGAIPLLWTTNLMAPEAYTLKAAVDGWLLGETGDAVRRRAAEAYQKYQKCGMKAALQLFASGW
jgi:hypothetical protein